MKRRAPWWTIASSAALVAAAAGCTAQSSRLGGAAVPPAASGSQAEAPADATATAGEVTVAPEQRVAEQLAAEAVAQTGAATAPTGAAGDTRAVAGAPVSDVLAAAQPASVDAAVDPDAAPTIAPVSPVVVLPTGFQIAGFAPGPGCPPSTLLAAVSYGRMEIGFLDKFVVGPNQGRVQCTAQLLVKVPAGLQFTLADYKQNYSPAVPFQSGQAMFSGRMNGTDAKALVDFSWTIPSSPPVTLNRAYSYAGGSVVWNNSLGDFVFPAATVFPFSACSSQPTTQTIALTIDVAAASNYTMPWPPPPFAQNERFFLNAIRFAPKWQAC